MQHSHFYNTDLPRPKDRVAAEQATVPSKLDPREVTEDWHFARNSLNTLIDEQPELLMRSNFSGP
ncbi:unnamed protein product, partial [Rotaria magnacalcarata]